MALLFFKNFVVPRERSYRPLDAGNDLEASASDAFLPPHERTSSDVDPTEKVSPSDLDDDTTNTSSDADTSNTSEAANFRAHLLSNFTIGFSDGLTVPFAVTAGLSTLGRPRVVIFGGLSELVAGTISMGMGGYLGAKGEVDAYTATRTTTQQTLRSDSGLAKRQVTSALTAAHIPPALVPNASAHILADPDRATDFLMRFHHHRPPSAFPAHYALFSGLVISLGYLSGGIVPLLPYLFVGTIDTAFALSIVVTACVLLAFGAGKTWVVGERETRLVVRGAAEMLVLGGTAAGAAVGCVRAFS